MRKIVPFFSFFIGVIGLLALIVMGCTKPKQDTSTVTVWHWMTDRNAAFEELAAQYEKETGVKVKIDLYPPARAAFLVDGL